MSMKMKRSIILGCLLVMLIPAGTCLAAQARNGTLDMVGWKTGEGPVMLNGQWQAAFNRLLGPADPAWSTVHETFVLPGLWHWLPGKTVMTAMGKASFRLTLTNLPENLNHAALYIPDILSVGKVWINGRLLAQTGRIGTDKDSEQPRIHALLITFTPKGAPLDILIQISNFHNARGGINHPIWFGPAPAVHDMVSRKRIVTTLISAAFMMIGLFHLSLFLLNRTEPAHAWFGLYVLTWAVQTFFMPAQGNAGTFIFKGMPWHLPIDLSLSAIAAGPPLLIMYYHALFPKSWGRRMNQLFQAAGLIFFIYVVLPPANAYDPVCLAYFFFTLTGFIYLLVRLILDLKSRQPGVAVLLPGFGILIFMVINDILGDSRIIQGGATIPLGLFAFILSYSVFICLRLSRTFARIRELSKTLQTQNQELSKLDRLKDQFLANTSHELKTPLNGIMGLAQSLADQALPPRAAKGIAIIEASARRLLSLINDILDLSLLKNRDLALEMTSVNLKPVVDAVLMVMAPLTGNRPLILENRIPDDFPILMCDENRLHQILFNLVGNGIKFTQEGTVLIQAYIRDNMARISVRDTGIGIDPAIQERIFNAFEQGENAPRGTGLGLAISRDLVRLNGGTMGVEATSGGGATFWFTLPLWPEGKPKVICAPPKVDRPLEPRPFGTVPAQQRQPGEDTPLILAVDDDPINLTVVVNHLEGEGFGVETAGSGEAALQRISKPPRPDLVLLDLMMPGLNGYDTCNRIREDHSPSELPVIMLTARHGVADLVKGLALGANDYLTKPFEREELKARVKTQLHLKQAFQAVQENETLKAALARQQKRENVLKMAQRRLSDMLNRIKEAVLVVNPGREMAFINQACGTLLGQNPEVLLGKPVAALFENPADPALDCLGLCLDSKATRAPALDGVTLKGGKDGHLCVDITIGPMALNDEDFCFLILREPHKSESSSVGRIIRYLDTMSLNRERLAKLDLMLQGMSAQALNEGTDIPKEIGAIDRIMAELVRAPAKTEEDPKDLLIRVMNLSVELWIADTGTTRVELAEQSGIWNVYIGKDGWARTQTLDKYLNPASLPKRPKWDNVINTADFVLAACSTADPVMRGDLEEVLARLRRAV